MSSQTPSRQQQSRPQPDGETQANPGPRHTESARPCDMMSTAESVEVQILDSMRDGGFVDGKTYNEMREQIRTRHAAP